MDDSLHRVAAALDVPTLDAAEIDAVLDLARDVARGVERRYAPLTAFLAGVAVGRGTPLATAVDAVRAAVSPPGS